MNPNTGGPASEKTLLDEFAGQALEGRAHRFDHPHERRDLLAQDCYDIAESMLAEKARREAVVKPATSLDVVARERDQALDRVAELEAAVKESSTTDHSPDATKMIQDHSPDAGKMAKQPDACVLLQKFIHALPDGHKTSALWDIRREAISLLEFVPDYTGKLERAEALNRELVEALSDLVSLVKNNNAIRFTSEFVFAESALAKAKGAA